LGLENFKANMSQLMDFRTVGSSTGVRLGINIVIMPRWGPLGLEDYKSNVRQLMDFLADKLPNVEFIWLTCPMGKSSVARGPIFWPKYLTTGRQKFCSAKI
jgi:hypothetical protein